MKRASLLALLAVTACAGHAPPESFRGTAGIVEESAQTGAPRTLMEVTAGRHDGYDRIVFRFATGLPGYHLEYIDRPVRACGSGKVVELPGQGWLAVEFEPAQAHSEAGAATAPRRLAADLPVVKALAVTCDFEGRLRYVAAMRAPNRFRVMELTDPPRLVVDVRH